ncbi:MAG: hypothetical protein WD988_02200 [Candidatus Curtissbacteria bacterium]
MNLSDKELLEYSKEHIGYELDMFRQSFIVLKSKKEFDWVTRMSLIESLLNHSRVLLNFTYPDPSNIRNDDILAEHYFDNPKDWNKIRPELSENLKKLRKRVGKELAHLTAERISGTPPEKGYPDGWFNEVWKTLQLFAQKASTKKLNKETVDILSKTLDNS